MQKSISILLWTLILTAAGPLANAGSGKAANPEPPKIYFEYGSVHDIGCEKMLDGVPKGLIKNRKAHFGLVMQEARELTRRLQKRWDKQGPPLLEKVFEIVGRKHHRTEYTVYTFACEFGAMSAPLMMSVRRQLKTIRKDPTSENNLIETTLHEFLHKYLSASFSYAKSEVLKKYKDRNSLFRNHLHLMALLHETLLRANRPDLLDRAGRLYLVYSKGSEYEEAWKLGTSKELKSKLLDEIVRLEGSNKGYEFFENYPRKIGIKPVKKSG